MEFKGTKEVKLSETNTGKFKVIDHNGFSICTASGYGLESKSNMLLYSKAPEMLEMLNKVLEINKTHNFNGHLINEQITQLIKQATEL